MKGSKRGTKTLTLDEQKERQKRVDKIKTDMLKKIHIIKPNFKKELKKQLERSKRSEHVFNNNILKFHSKVLKEFKERHRIDKQRGYDQHQQALKELGKHTLTPDTAREIQTHMVVHFDEDEFYVNANAVVYGVYCSVLREAMLVVLGHKNPGDVTEAEKQSVNLVIDNMNNRQIYVDHMAKVKWIANIATRQARFEEVRGEVVHMYNTDRGVDWCIRILTEVAPLFNRQ